MTFTFNTGIELTSNQHCILCYLIKHLKAGLWKKSKPMARYRNSLAFDASHSQLVLVDYHNQCTKGLPEFFADMIKQLIEAEMQDSRGAKNLEWSRDCLVCPKYFGGLVTAQDCYEFYEILMDCKDGKLSSAEPNRKSLSVMPIQLTPAELNPTPGIDMDAEREKAADRMFNRLFKNKK